MYIHVCTFDIPPSSAKEPRRRDKAEDEQGAGDGLGSTRRSICNPGLPATGTLTLEAMRQINFAELSSANLLPARGTGGERHRGRPDPHSRTWVVPLRFPNSASSIHTVCLSCPPSCPTHHPPMINDNPNKNHVAQSVNTPSISRSNREMAAHSPLSGSA